MPIREIDVPGTRITFALLAAAALISLTACGGSSTNSGTMGTTVTASFANDAWPSAAAYQAGVTGTFQTLAISGSSVSFTLPPGTTAYGFAYMCPTFFDASHFSNETIVQATTTDTTSLSLACPSLSGSISATFDVSAIPGATSTALYEGYWADEMYGTSGVLSLPGIPTGTFDVALVAYGANGALGIQIQRGINVTSYTSIAFPPMTAADELGSAPVRLTNVPSGATNSGFDTTYQTSGGLSVTLLALLNGVPQSSYPTVPSSQSQSGDFYLIHAGAIVSSTQVISSLVSSNTASAVTVELPAPSNSLTAPVAAAFPTFNAIASEFSVEGPVVNASFTQFQTAIDNYTVHNVYTFVTNAWLGTNTTFTVPDLSTLPLFTPAPPSGAREFWTLYSTAGTPLQFTSLQQSGPQLLTSPTSLQSIQTGGAFIVP